MPMITITEGHSLSKWKPNKHEEEKMRSLIVDFINRLKMNKSPSEHNMICLAKPKRGAGLAKDTYAQKMASTGGSICRNIPLVAITQISTFKSAH